MKTQGKITSTLVGVSLAATNIACRIAEKIPVIGEVNVNFSHNNTGAGLSLDYRDPRGQWLHESLGLTINAGEFYLTRFGAYNRGSYGQEVGKNKNGTWVESRYDNGVWVTKKFDFRDHNPFRRR